MIDQLPDKTWKAQCDGCGAVIHTGLKSFQQAVNFISRAEGWHNRRLRGVWNNYCPRCGEEANDFGIVGIGFTKRPVTEDDY